MASWFDPRWLSATGGVVMEGAVRRARRAPSRSGGQRDSHTAHLGQFRAVRMPRASQGATHIRNYPACACCEAPRPEPATHSESTRAT